MAIALSLKKLLSILALTLALSLMAPDIALGIPSKLNVTTTQKTAHLNPVFSEEKLTPQERQELQAVRQRRNREIAQVLNSQQRQQLEHNLRSGHDLEYAIDALDIDHEQWDTIQAIMELSKLKIKGILYRHSLAVEPS